MKVASLTLFSALGMFSSLTASAHFSSRILKRDSVATPNNYTFAMYYANWDTYDRNFQVYDLPIDYIPEIDYAFVKLSANSDGTYSIVTTDQYADTDKVFKTGISNPPFNGNLGQLYSLKQSGKNFNLKLALGGWTLSGSFSSAMATATSRASVITSLIAYLNTYPIFNGISIDWEFVSNNGVNYGQSGNTVSTADSDNLILFLKELRAAFTSKNKANYEIAFCVTAAPEKAQFDMGTVASLVNEFHVLTYDFASSAFGDIITTHHTNLYPTSNTKYSIKGAVDFYLSKGVPASKIMIGAAFYSRGFANTNGLGKSGSGTVSVTSWEQGIADYKILPPNGFTEYWDAEAQATYAYNPATKEFLSYDSVQSIQAKCDYVKKMGLKGMVAWEAAGDVAVTNSRSLIKTIYTNLIQSSDAAPSSGNSTENSSTTATPSANSTDSQDFLTAAQVSESNVFNLDEVVKTYLGLTNGSSIIGSISTSIKKNPNSSYVLIDAQLYKLNAVQTVQTF